MFYFLLLAATAGAGIDHTILIPPRVAGRAGTALAALWASGVSPALELLQVMRTHVPMHVACVCGKCSAVSGSGAEVGTGPSAEVPPSVTGAEGRANAVHGRK